MEIAYTDKQRLDLILDFILFGLRFLPWRTLTGASSSTTTTMVSLVIASTATTAAIIIATVALAVATTATTTTVGCVCVQVCE